jgi:hypothetical protein
VYRDELGGLATRCDNGKPNGTVECVENLNRWREELNYHVGRYPNSRSLRVAL